MEVQDDIFDQAKKNLKGCNVEFIRKPSLAAVKDFERNSLDYVFIDGDHRYNAVAVDIVEWSRIVRPGGIVAAHDFFLGEPGVFHAVQGYILGNNIRPYYITKENMPTVCWVQEDN